MPYPNLSIGPYVSAYAGDASPSVAVLTQLISTRTEGSDLDYGMEEAYVDVADNSIQIGRALLNFNLTFYGFDDETIMKLAMGNSVEDLGVEIDDPSSFQKYTLLLLDSDPDSPTSTLIPECYTLKRLRQPRRKQSIAQMRIDFTSTNRNRFIQLFRQGTYTELATILGARSPI